MTSTGVAASQLGVAPPVSLIPSLQQQELHCPPISVYYLPPGIELDLAAYFALPVIDPTILDTQTLIHRNHLVWPSRNPNDDLRLAGR